MRVTKEEEDPPKSPTKDRSDDREFIGSSSTDIDARMTDKARFPDGLHPFQKAASASTPKAAEASSSSNSKELDSLAARAKVLCVNPSASSASRPGPSNCLKQEQERSSDGYNVSKTGDTTAESSNSRLHKYGEHDDEDEDENENEELPPAYESYVEVGPNEKVWLVKGVKLRLSALEGAVTVKNGIFSWEDFDVIQPSSHIPPLNRTASSSNTIQGPSDPITGGLSALLNTVGTVADRVSDYPKLLARVLDAENDSQAGQEISSFIGDAGKGVTGMSGAVLKGPVDLSHDVARGFHNLPRLYGDDTVRDLDQVTGMQSGLQAAGMNFGFGLWDGISGLVTQPVKGAQEGGLLGGLLGIGKGIGGAVIKPTAGVLGLPGYALKGVYEELRSLQGPASSSNDDISHNGNSDGEADRDGAEALILRGLQEYKAASGEERTTILLQIKRRIEDLETLEGYG